jgi:hypothetical protein
MLNMLDARKFEYLSEFKAEIENTSDGESGAQGVVSFSQTSLKPKILLKCTLQGKLV